MKKKSSLPRRDFLKMLTVGTCGAACHNVLGANSTMAFAAQPTGKIRRVVEVFFYGGHCSYGLFPQHNAGAQAKYPTLYRTPAQAVYIGHPDQGLHQAFQPFVTEANLTGPHVALIVGTAAMNAKGQFSRSHDEGQNANERVSLDYTMGTAMGVGAAIAQEIGHPYSLISFGGSSDFAVGGAVPARSIGSLENAGLPGFSQDNFYRLTQANAAAATAGPGTAAQTYIQTSLNGMQQNLATLQNLADINPQFPFPNTGIANTFRDITRLITANLGNVFFVPFGGFDTHGQQAGQHQNLVTQLNNALVPFIRNLKALPGQSLASAWEETVVVTRTDFGRTFENNNERTDHGLCYTQMVIGGSVNGGVWGDPANAAKYQNETNGYQGPSWAQFSAGQPTKEIVQIGMGLTNVQFPDYIGNRFAPIGFIS